MTTAADRVLRATVRSAGLHTLDLRVTDRPDLALLVRGTHPGPRLAAWRTTVEPGEWHDRLVLVATAPQADATRRAAVRDAGEVLAELLAADGRRAYAERDAEQAHRAAGVDALTGLGNRWAWKRALDAQAARSSRYRTPSSVVVLDLDGLKLINDRHGHAEGDAYLQRASGALRRASRAVDAVCRLGGDEFAILAPETGEEGAQRLAERLRAELERVGVRASIGTATSPLTGPETALDDVWHAADASMYDSKRDGATGRRTDVLGRT